MHSLPETLRSALRANAGPEEYALKMQAYAKSEMPLLGIKSAVLKKVIRKTLKSNPLETFAECENVVRELFGNAVYREERWAAVNIAGSRSDFIRLEALPVYRWIIETGAWWDIVDGVCMSLLPPLHLKHRDEMQTEMKRWIEDEHLWIRRAAVLSQLKLKNDLDETLLFDFCRRCLHEKTFWMRKAIGWALRDYSKTNPDSVRHFVEEYGSQMAGLTRREASKYI